MLTGILNYFFEIFLALYIIVLYYLKLKPKVRYLFYGFFFFFVSLILQFPIRYILVGLDKILIIFNLTELLFIPLSIVVVEVTKYFSLKKFIKTRSLNFGLFFTVGWVSLASINYFTIIFFNFVLGFLSLSFDFSYLLNPNYNFFYFAYYFILNLAVSVFVISAIVYKNIYYLILGILFSLVSAIGILYFDSYFKFIFIFIMFIISVYILFNSKFKKHSHFSILFKE